MSHSASLNRIRQIFPRGLLFIDKYGNIASNVIDGYGNVYIINQEKELNTALKEIFKQIEEDLKQNNNQSKSKRLTLQTLPRLDNKK